MMGSEWWTQAHTSADSPWGEKRWWALAVRSEEAGKYWAFRLHWHSLTWHAAASVLSTRQQAGRTCNHNNARTPSQAVRRMYVLLLLWHWPHSLRNNNIGPSFLEIHLPLFFLILKDLPSVSNASTEDIWDKGFTLKFLLSDLQVSLLIVEQRKGVVLMPTYEGENKKSLLDIPNCHIPHTHTHAHPYTWATGATFSCICHFGLGAWERRKKRGIKEVGQQEDKTSCNWEKRVSESSSEPCVLWFAAAALGNFSSDHLGFLQDSTSQHIILWMWKCRTNKE